MKELSLEEKLSAWFYNIVYSRLGVDRKALVDGMAKDIAAQQSAHLTTLRRGLALSILFNIILLAVVLFTIGSR